MTTWQDRVAHRTVRVAIVGLGYVGLPLATAFAKAHFPVVGIDVDPRRIEAIAAGRSTIADISDQDLAPYVRSGQLRVTCDYDALRETDAIFICVPTPYDAQRAPDLSYIVQASEGIRPRLQPGQLIVLQSTTYPGTTQEVVLPILERDGLKGGQDFYLAFSPERVDPGNTQWTAYNTPKVVGGLTPECTQIAAELLRQMGAPVHAVSSPKAAELAKLLENTFRSVNIALVNELALLAERMGIDFWEVIDAAKTKPFGFMPFYPGPGVGGHCIPVDPYFLSWKAREYDYYAEFIELAGEVNQAMPYHVVELVGQALSMQGSPMRGARLLVLGVAFKANIDDARNSPAQRVIELLLSRGADVRYHDPHVPHFRVGGNVFWPAELTLDSAALSETELEAADCVVIVTGHRSVDYGQVATHARLVVDTCHATKAALSDPARAALRRKVVRLGAPMEWPDE
ncbi:MAG: nucleotide sugar dehydrogenase [Anaerolineales bacterium]|nr:nucleotide sugar dehydrogenase [Anaerolineales bacterium]